MFDQMALWEMNKAHHQDLLAAAANHRLLARVRTRVPVLLEDVLKVIRMPRRVAARGRWHGRRLAGHGFVR